MTALCMLFSHNGTALINCSLQSFLLDSLLPPCLLSLLLPSLHPPVPPFFVSIFLHLNVSKHSQTFFILSPSLLLLIYLIDCFVHLIICPYFVLHIPIFLLSSFLGCLSFFSLSLLNHSFAFFISSSLLCLVLLHVVPEGDEDSQGQ